MVHDEASGEGSDGAGRAAGAGSLLLSRPTATSRLGATADLHTIPFLWRADPTLSVRLLRARGQKAFRLTAVRSWSEKLV